MGRTYTLFIFIQCLIFFAQSFAEIDSNQRDKYLKSLTDYLNNVSEQNHLYEDGVLVNEQRIDDSTYVIEINVKQKDRQDRSNFKHLTCTAYVRESTNGETTVSVSNVQCHDGIVQQQVLSTAGSINDNTGNGDGGVSTVDTEEHAVRLDNEVQSESTVFMNIKKYQ